MALNSRGTLLVITGAKGIANWTVVWKHAFRNALIPPLTMMAVMLAGFLDGSVVIEQVFAWSGIGRMAVQAIYNNDFPILTTCVLLFGSMLIVANLVADILYAYLGPGIRCT